MNLEDRDGCSRIIYSHGISSQRWLHVSNKNQPSHKFSIRERAEAFGALLSVGHAMSLGTCTQTPRDQMQHVLCKGPEHLGSLISQCAKRHTGVLQPTVFLVTEHLLSIAPLRPYTICINRGRSQCFLGSEPGRDLRFGFCWAQQVALICVNKVPVSV